MRNPDVHIDNFYDSIPSRHIKDEAASAPAAVFPMVTKNEIVAKSNRLIQAGYRLTLNEQRLILYAISRCREEQKGLTADTPVTITATSFLKQFPSIDPSNVYRRMVEAMDGLFERFVTLYDTEPTTDEARVTKTRWISTASYIDGAGQIQLIFAPLIVKYITRLEKEFTPYRLDKVAGMSSTHAVRLYELMQQYRRIGQREISLAALRAMFQVDPGEYKLTADFIKRIVNVAVEQVNQHSDLSVTYQPKKTGRAITHFLFKIKSSTPELELADDQAYREKLEANGQQRLDEPTETF